MRADSTGAPAPHSEPPTRLVDVFTSVRPSEMDALRELAVGQTVLECGAFYGASTIALARVARVVHSVDWHHGDEQAGKHETLCLYMDNLRRYGVADKVITHVGRFEDVLPRLRPASFDGCFLDGLHDRASVERDLRLIRPLMRRRGWIAAHDFGIYGVEPAIHAFIAGSTYRLDSIVETLAILRPARAWRRAARRLPAPVKDAARRLIKRVA